MRRTLKLTIAYDGGDFHGWQQQPGVRTVQGEMLDVLRRVMREPVTLVGASRTDAGVHARGQVAHVVTQTPIPDERLHDALNHRLPRDVSICRLQRVSDEFHAIRNAQRKLYRYRLFTSLRQPVQLEAQRRAWHVWNPLDVDRMQAAARRLVGTHDFAGFATATDDRETTVRSVLRCAVRRFCEDLWIDVEGGGFLYHQVRIMTGTLVEIGRGRWAPERIDEILATADRRLAGPTAPPQGLCLQWIQHARHPADAAVRIAEDRGPEETP